MNPAAATSLIHGTAHHPAPPRSLRAGPFTLDYDAGDLRGVRLGDREVLRRIYGAVRDRNWGTVPGQITEEQVEPSETGFRIRYRSVHCDGDIHFEWHAELSGGPDGTLRFTFDGEAKSTFWRNRIGLCVLHPMEECAGVQARAHLIDGSVRELVFPTVIAAEQPIHGFETLSGLAHEVEPGLWVEVRFLGEVFETEDQRNWIDASFKTYGTPHRLPFPVKVHRGERIHQSVEVRVLPRTKPAKLTGRSAEQSLAPEITQSSADRPVCVSVPTHTGVPLPRLGLATASHGQPLTNADLIRLRPLPLQHLRAEVSLGNPDWRIPLLAAAESARALSLPLELAVHLPADGVAKPVAELRGELARLEAKITSILALQDGQKSTTPVALGMVRQHLSELAAHIGAGTNADLYQLNLQRPPDTADFIAWSMNPQVHASDTRSLMETPAAAAAQVASVRTYFPGVPLAVSPITLKPRFNPVATAAAARSGAGPLPPEVDPRQTALVGAAWTVAMLAALAPSGVDSLTFFETSGWRGVLETTPSSPWPDAFPSIPGSVYPLWHVFAALYGFDSVAAVTVSDPRKIAAFVLTSVSGEKRLIMANLTTLEVEVRFVAGSGAARQLGGADLMAARQIPAAWWTLPLPRRTSTWRLSAFDVAFIDLH